MVIIILLLYLQVKFRIVYYEDEATLSHSSGGLAMFLCLYHLGTRLDHACIIESVDSISRDGPDIHRYIYKMLNISELVNFQDF